MDRNAERSPPGEYSSPSMRGAFSRSRAFWICEPVHLLEWLWGKSPPRKNPQLSLRVLFSAFESLPATAAGSTPALYSSIGLWNLL